MGRDLGRYVLGDLLGRGLLAEVFGGYAVGEHGFEKPVVIKRLLPHVARDRGFVARLIQQAKRQVGTHHGNLVSVLDLVCDREDIFVVMEFVDGPSLREVIAARRISLGLGAYIVQSAAAGVQAARARCGAETSDVDLSPSNLLCTKSGEVRIGDLGLTRNGGGSCDVHALGFLLYQLVTGAPAVPPGLNAICMRALTSDPRQRFPRVRDLVDALVELQYALQWRDGASELAREIRELRGERADTLTTGKPNTLVTGKPITLITRSLIEELPTRRRPALSLTSDDTIARTPPSRAITYALVDGRALAIFAVAALFGTVAAIVV